MNKEAKIIIASAIAIIALGVILIGFSKVKSPAKNEAVKSEKTSPIKIGFIGPLTGDTTNIGQNAKAAVQLAVNEVNSAGGINGRPLEVIYEDGQCAGKAASNAANKLLNVDKVPVILGGACSGETLSFAPAAEQAKTVVLSYCSSASAITQAGDYIFRDYPSDLYQGKFVADYFLNKLGKKRAAVLYMKTDWGTGIKNVFADYFKNNGGEIVADEGYDQTSRDLRTQLTKIKAAKPDIVYFLAYEESAIPGIKQARELGLNIPIFGGDVWESPKIWESVGGAGEGAMYSVVYTPLSDEFKAKMKAAVSNGEITLCSPEAYDGIKILAQAMAKAGTNSEDIKSELYKTSYTGGVSAEKIEFDQNGDLVGANYVVKIIKDGKAEEVR